MPRQPSVETQLKSARAELRRTAIELAQASQRISEWRARASKAEQEAEEWKRRFDILLAITKDGPKKGAPGVKGPEHG